MQRSFFFLMIILWLLTACQAGEAAPPPTAAPGSLYVNPEINLGPISPLVYGSNFGPWTAVPAGMMDYAIDSQVTNLRFPAGEWGDNNDIQDYQIDQFMYLLEQMGAIPTISVRMVDGTPEAAAELVRYCNIENDYNVIYWSIGNEPTLYEGRPGVDSFDTERFNREWRAIAEAMKAVDPNIKLMGPELHGTYTSNYETNPKDSAGRDWMTEFLEANGDLVDIVTYHRYPFPLSTHANNATIAELRQDLPEWTRTVQYLRNLIREKTGRDLPIGITETNSHYNHATQGEATPDSFYNAIWWADVLGRTISEDVFIVNYFMLTSSSANQVYGLIERGRVTPTYYVYQIYRHFGDQQVYASSGVDGLNVYAARNEDGNLTVMVINIEDDAHKATLNLEGINLDQAELWLFDADHNAENLGLQTLAAQSELVFPAQSVSLYVINP